VGISSYLIAVYAFSLFFSIWLYNFDSKYQHASFLPSIIFCASLLLYFVPFFKKELKIEATTNPKFVKHFCIVGYGLSIILIIGCLLLLPKIQETIAYGLVESRQSMYRGEDSFMPYTLTEHIGHSTVKWLGGLSYSILIMFFYALAFIKNKILLKALLILSSLSATYWGLLVGGRTNLIYWVLFFLFCLILFWPYLSKKSKRIIFIVSIVFFSIIGSYFIFISIERAERGHGGETGNFLKLYAGQSYLNFCYFYENMNYHPYSLYRIFPLTSNLLLERFDLREYRDLIYSNSKMDIGLFYTLLGDLYVDVGLIGMFIYSIIYFLITKRVMKRKRFTLSNLLILGVLYQIPLHGIFYYSLWKMESSACIIITILIAIYLYPNKLFSQNGRS
jgi:oligosaccharide repeat unit polymerase